MKLLARESSQQMLSLEKALAHHAPSKHLERAETILQSKKKEMANRIRELVRQKTHEWQLAGAKLEEKSPLKILTRGYSMARIKDQIITSVDDVSEGDTLETIVADGIITSTIKTIKHENQIKGDKES